MTAAEMFCERVLDGITNWDKPKSRQDEENVSKSKGAGEKAKVEKLADGGNAESAIDAAIAYLEREGDEPTRRNVFAKDWALKKPDGKGKTSKTAQDELYEALVEDAESLTDKTLAEHDKERHPHGYHEGDTCKFRENMMVETETDKADEVDAGKVGRETTGGAEQHGQTENKREGVSVDKPQAKIYDGISKNKVEKYKGQMAKKHPELDADLILTELAKIKDPKLQGDAFAWVMKGAIKLPEDMYKVEKARELAGKAKRDPLSWETPQACINELLGEGHKVKEKPITVEELKKNPLMSDYRDEGYGVETFQVEDSRNGMELIRDIINSHLGIDRNPWCLSKADENGNLIDEAYYWWTEYDKIPKRVAFKDGRIIAFSASTQPFRGYNVNEVLQRYPQLEFDYARDVEEGRYDDDISYWLRKYHSEKFNRDPKDEDTEGRPWYNLWDEKHEGIPLGINEVPNDKLGRKAQCELRGGEILVPKDQSWFVGTPGQPGYKKWWTSASKGEGDNLEEEITEEGTIITYGRDGKTVEKKYRPGVGKIRYYKDGSVSEEYNDKDELVVSFYEDGKKSYQRFVDGGYVFYDEEGNIELDKRKSRKAKEMERPVFDELVIALVGENYVEDADTLPQGETLEEHDRKKHKGHFDPSTQTCKFRDEMKKETETDRADEISPESAPKAEGGEEVVQNKPLVSPEEDKAYMEAVNRGDMDTAAKMVREVAGRAFPNTKVIDKDGKPSIVFHGTEADFTEFDPSTISRESGNFGYFGKGFYFAGREDLGDYYAFIRQGKRMNEFVDIQNPFVYNDETIAKIAKEIGLDNDLEKDWSLLEQPSHFSNQESVEKFTEAIKGLGYDGVLVYDRAGLGELVAFKPNQIKSADPVTYDDNGNVIPLSRRFDDGDDIRGDVSVGGDDKPSSVEQEESENLESYDKNFTEDGEWKSPWNKGGPTFDTRKSVGVARNPWTKASRAEAEVAAQMLKRVLGGVTVGFSDKPYEGEGDTRKSIGGIFTGTSADYANESRQGGVGDGPGLMKIGSGEGSQVYGWGLYGSNQRGVAETYADETSDRHGYTGYSKGGKLIKTNEGSGDVESDAATMLALYGEVETAKKEALSFPNGEAIAKELDEHGDEYKEEWPHRNIYEQTFFTNRVPGDESHLLKWYEPVSEEMKRKILNSLDSLKASDVEGLKTWEVTDSEAEEDLNDLKTEIRARLERSEELTGEDLYRLFAYTKTPSHYQMGVKAASGVLSKLDIDGIKYPVDSYGGKAKKDGNEAGWNYVSFRDDNIKVDHKWVDGEQRYFRNQSGKVVGEYDRNTNKITLYPGATVRDVVHEYSHGLWQFAEQEAEAGRGDLLDKIKSIADTAPEEVKSAVAANYEEVTPDVYLEECFTHEMARRSDSAFAKAIESKQGKPWYKRAWGAIKDAWKGLATKMGLNKADISKIGKMSDGEAAEHILSQMMAGRRFGEVKKGQGDTRNSKSAGDTFELPNGTKVPANLAYLYKGMDGTPHNEKWSPFLEKTTGNGAISKEFSDVLDQLFSGKLVDADTIKAIPEWKNAMQTEKQIQDELDRKHGVRTTAEIKDEERSKLHNAIVEAAMTDHITRTVPLEGFDGMEFETNEGLKDGESYDVEKGRVMTVVIGLPAAGKSTTFANPLAKKFKARLCDSDTIKKTLPEFHNGYGGNVVHEESTKINEEILKRSIEQGDNIVYPILGYKPEKLKKLFGKLRDKGYRINLCLKDMPANIALGRLLGRFMGKGRYLPVECITKAMGKFGNCFEQVKDLVDAYVRSTSDPDGTNERVLESKGDLI